MSSWLEEHQNRDPWVQRRAYGYNLLMNIIVDVAAQPWPFGAVPPRERITGDARGACRHSRPAMKENAT